MCFAVRKCSKDFLQNGPLVQDSRVQDSSWVHLLLRAPKVELAVEQLLTEDAGPTKERYPTPKDKEEATTRQIHFKRHRNQTSCFGEKKNKVFFF